MKRWNCPSKQVEARDMYQQAITMASDDSVPPTLPSRQHSSASVICILGQRRFRRSQRPRRFDWLGRTDGNAEAEAAAQTVTWRNRCYGTRRVSTTPSKLAKRPLPRRKRLLVDDKARCPRRVGRGAFPARRTRFGSTAAARESRFHRRRGPSRVRSIAGLKIQSSQTNRRT